MKKLLAILLGTGFLVAIASSFYKTYPDAEKPAEVLKGAADMDFRKGLKEFQHEPAEDDWVPTGYRYRMIVGESFYATYDEAERVKFQVLTSGVNAHVVPRPNGSYNVVTEWHSTRGQIDELRKLLVQDSIKYHWETESSPKTSP